MSHRLVPELLLSVGRAVGTDESLEVEELFDAVADATEVGPVGPHLDKTTKNNFTLIRSAFIQQLVTQMGTDDMPDEQTQPMRSGSAFGAHRPPR